MAAFFARDFGAAWGYPQWLWDNRLGKLGQRVACDTDIGLRVLIEVAADPKNMIPWREGRKKKYPQFCFEPKYVAIIAIHFRAAPLGE